MAQTLSRIDRQPWTIAEADLRKKLPNGGPASITGVDVALLPKGAAPTAATVWLSAAWTAGTGSLILAGPDADSTSALVVTADADLWVKASGAPYVEAVKWERITVLDTSGTVSALPSTYVTSVNGLSGSVTLASTITDNGDGTATSGIYSVTDHGDGTATAA